MWLRVSTLFLTVSLAGVVLSARTAVFLGDSQGNSQGSVNVPSGSSLTLHCCLNAEDRGKPRMEWFFKPFNSSDNEPQNLFLRIYEEGSLERIQDLKSCQDTKRTHTLSYVNGTHSGWYHCKVTQDIPILRSRESKSSEVYVSKNTKESTTYPSQDSFPRTVTPPDSGVDNTWWIWIIVGVSSGLLVVLLLLVICVLRKRGCPTSTAADPIYANTKPSPRLVQNHLKTVSSSPSSSSSRPAHRYHEDKRSYKHRGGP